MDDEQVKAVLAEFMGYVQVGSLWREDSCGRPDSYIRTDHLPRYLTDYNAIAEVWRRVNSMWYGDSRTDEDAVRLNLAMGNIVKWFAKKKGCDARDIDLTLNDMFDPEPRDHAHALAKAILEVEHDRQG